MPEKTFYVTTPIYYVNADPHLGSSYTTIMCDILRRYYDLLGYQTYFLTGTDEHGEKIFREANAQGRDVREMVDDISQKFRDLCPKLNISNDDFIRTTEERHARVVQMILQYTYDRGDIYQAEYSGNYCVGCERYYTDREVEAKPGYCPIHEKPLEFYSERNYFFRLSKYQDWLREKVEREPDFIGPPQFRSEVLALLREPLDDLCISRPVERLHWGIPIPFDDKFVTYVWYDALTNYISALDYPDGEKFARFWPSATHLIGKDILRQHAIYWPCMLKAAGIEPFKRLRVHGYWTANGRKISKSLGNAVDPLEEIQKYGLDVYRYFSAREMSFGSDGDYSAKALAGRNNAELADDLGNLLSRVTAMIAKYFDGKMPAAENPTEADQALVAELDRLRDELPGHLERCSIHAFLERVNHAVVLTNRYLTEQAPWTRAKEGNMARVGTILAVASRMLAGVARFLYPVMPGKMTDLLAAYGLPKPERLENAAVPAGIRIEPAKPLFPQLEVPEPAAQAAEAVGAAPGAPEKSGETAPAAKEGAAKEGAAKEGGAKEGAAVKKSAASGDAAAQSAPLKPEITIDDFVKVDLRIATVLEAEPVPKTDKLMRLTIDIGVEKRQIVAGIAEHYKAQDLVGRQIVVVANLAPRKLKGLESKGMLLAAKIGGELFLLRPDDHLAPGADVS